MTRLPGSERARAWATEIAQDADLRVSRRELLFGRGQRVRHVPVLLQNRMVDVAFSRAVFAILTISVLMRARTASERVLARINVGSKPYGLALSLTNKRLYVTNRGDDTVSIINTVENRVVNTLKVCKEPGPVSVNPGGIEVYVGCDNVLAVISTDGKSCKRAIPISGHVHDLAIYKYSHYLWIAAEWGGLQRYDVESSRLDVMSSTVAPENLALSLDGRLLYVNYQAGGPGGTPGHDAVGVFDTGSGRPIASIQGFPNVGKFLAITPDGDYLWVNGSDACASRRYDHRGCETVPSEIVLVVSLKTHKIVRQFPWINSYPGAIRFSPFESIAIVTGQGSFFFDVAVMSRLRAFSQSFVSDLVFLTPNGLAYAALERENAIILVDISGVKFQRESR